MVELWRRERAERVSPRLVVRPDLLRDRWVEDWEGPIRFGLYSEDLDVEFISVFDVVGDDGRLVELGGGVLVLESLAEGAKLLPLFASDDEALATDGEGEGTEVNAEGQRKRRGASANEEETGGAKRRRAKWTDTTK